MNWLKKLCRMALGLIPIIDVGCSGWLGELDTNHEVSDVSDASFVFGVYSEDVYVSAIEFTRQPDGESIAVTHFSPGFTRRSVRVQSGKYCWVRAAVDFFNSGYEYLSHDVGQPLAPCFMVNPGQRFHWGVIRFTPGGFAFEQNTEAIR